MSIAQIKAKATELKGTGGGEALAAVVQAIQILEDQRGRLDYANTLIACFALIQAIAPTRQHADVLLDLAKRVGGSED